MLSIHPPHSVPQVLLMPLLYDRFFHFFSLKKVNLNSNIPHYFMHNVEFLYFLCIWAVEV